MVKNVSPKGADTINHDVKFKLRKEQLDIFKKKMKTGEVNIHKEVFTKDKTIVVPVICEELVIEKKIMKADNLENSEQTKIIRIPISEERIEIVKHPTALSEVSIYKREFQVIEHIERKLKTERLKIENNGTVK